MQLIARENQLLEQSAYIELYQIDLSAINGQVLYLTPMKPDQPSGKISFGGIEYSPWPMQVEGFEQSAGGTLPQPKMSFAIVDRTVMSLMRETGDMYGAIVKRIRTYGRFLDSGETPDGTEHMPIDEYRIVQRAAENESEIVFTLASDLEYDNVMIPNRQALRMCTHTYRVWDRSIGAFRYDEVLCPYAGNRYFDAQGNEVSDPAKDEPSFQVSTCCKKRFPSGPLPFGGIPGLGRTR